MLVVDSYYSSDDFVTSHARINIVLLWIIRYVKDTLCHGLHFLSFFCFQRIERDDDSIDRLSNTCYYFFLVFHSFYGIVKIVLTSLFEHPNRIYKTVLIFFEVYNIYIR